MQEIPDLVRRLLFRHAALFQSEARRLLALAGRHRRCIEGQHAPLLFQHAAQLFPNAFDAITVHDADCPAFTPVVGAPANRALHRPQICRRHMASTYEGRATPKE